jgi:glutaryl-CoA dehydrogenase
MNKFFSLYLVTRMGEMDLLGSCLPQEYGCAGVNNVDYGLFMQELERGNNDLRNFASVLRKKNLIIMH